MGLLVIETATAACSVALLDGDRLLAHAHEVVGRGHAERLVPMIGEVLAAAGLSSVARVRVDCGPGSFTGIRVGLAAARALGLAWGAEVGGFGAPALLAAAGHRGGACAVAIAGGHGELFVQRFAASLVAEGELCSLPPADAAAMVPEELVLGSGAEALVAARGWGEAVAALPDARDARLLPPALAALLPRPIYGRPPDAVPPR